MSTPSTNRPQVARPSDPYLDDMHSNDSTSDGSALIHFEGDWPYRERLWLRQRVQEADRTLARMLDSRSGGSRPGERSLLYGARWLAERSASEGEGVRLTVHRQGTSRVLVGESLGQIDQQIRRLPLVEQRANPA